MLTIMSMSPETLLMYVSGKKEGTWGVLEGWGVGGEINIWKYKRKLHKYIFKILPPYDLCEIA